VSTLFVCELDIISLEFNFCGSSKKSIATYFEGFGATKTEIAIWKKSIL
jgi:hypothetical protein